MKLGRLVDERLYKTLNKLVGAPLPIRTAFKLKGILKTVREEATKYEELRQEYLLKHGIKNEDGSLKIDERNCASFDEEGGKNFSKAMNDLAQVDVEMPQITVSELGDKILISLEELDILDGIIVE